MAPPSLPTQPPRRFGLRTFGMLGCAYIWSLFAAGAFREVSTPRPGVFHLTLDPDLRGWVWIGCAAVAVLTAWSRRGSWVGVACLSVMPFVQMVSWGMSWVLSVVPGGNPGYPDGWYSSAYNFAAVFIVILVACIPSPAPRLGVGR